MSHCTGEEAVERIKLEFGEGFKYNNTGNVIDLGQTSLNVEMVNIKFIQTN